MSLRQPLYPKILNHNCTQLNQLMAIFCYHNIKKSYKKKVFSYFDGIMLLKQLG
jgi:hypothetical protein